MFKTIIEQYGATPEIAQKHLKRIITDAFKNVLLVWHKKYFPLHFKTVAYYRYPGVYKKRSFAHNKEKQRLVGHNNPNVFRGRMEDKLRRAPKIGGTLATFRSASAHKPKGGGRGISGLYLTMKGPEYTDVYYTDVRRGRTAPNKKTELSTISQQEEQALAKIAEDEIVQRLNSIRESKRERL